jgi:hypothetical protein
MHPSLAINPAQAASLNEETNLRLLDTICECLLPSIARAA